jgi:hypothetical protein
VERAHVAVFDATQIQTDEGKGEVEGKSRSAISN